MKKLLTGVVIVLITAGMLNACSEMEDESPSSSSSEYTAPEYKEMPDLRHMSLEKAIATLHGEGWTDVEAVEENDGTESTVRLDQTGYHIASQNPHNGKTGVSTDTHVRLTVHKDRTRTISNLVAVNDPWDEAFEKLRSAGLERGCDYIRRMTNILRDFDYNPCNSIVLLPYCRYRVGGKGTVREMQVITLKFDDARNGRIVRACDDRLDWWHLTLGLKAWLGDVSIRDQHRALAWLLCTIHADGLVSYGVWMGGRPSREYTDPSVRELNEQADDDLRQRAKKAMERLRDPKDLVDLSIECEQEDYDMFAEACKQRGLSVQNGFHIALRRLIAWYRERQ